MVKVAIEILFNSKDLRYLEKAQLTDEEKLQIQALAADAEAALQPFGQEIEHEGGSVIVDFKGPGMFQIETNGLPEELKERVYTALRPARGRK